MDYEPIIKAKLAKFTKDYEIEGDEDKIFETYINYLILEQLHPGINDTDGNLLDQVCVGGNGDIGIDGIIIFANDRPIREKSDIDDILKSCRKIDFQFVFVQSKNKAGFKHDEFQVFLAGIEDFLRSQITMPSNEKVNYWHDIYSYVTSDDILLKQSRKPTISFYYVTTGKWNNQEYIVSDFNSFKAHLSVLNSFDEPQPYYIDSERLLSLINSNDNYYETVVNYVESMDLPEAEGTKRSTVVLCPAEEIVKLVTTEDGILRKNIFDNNVRDYQGNTDINLEITDTLKNRPEQFQLLNNGITVVCENLEQGNRRLIINSPQVVNGCQTCNVLYRCNKSGVDLSRAMAVVKFISSDDFDIINSIIRGTNRQNIVYEEAFEVTREYHKSLEQFFMSYQVGDFPKIYYERRSKQFENDSSIKLYQRVNFRIMIQSAVGLVLGKVHDSYKHESRLLKEYTSSLFVDGQSFLSYYSATFLYKHIDSMLRKRIIPPKFKPYPMHIAYTLMLQLNGKPSDINNAKKIDSYYKNLLSKIINDEMLVNAVVDAYQKFDEIISEWVEEKGETYKSGIKDSAAFTDFMVRKLLSPKTDVPEKKNDTLSENEVVYRGKVLNVGKDINGLLYGFIERQPDNVFFHISDNPTINTKFVGRDVTYETQSTNGSGIKAINVKLIE